MLKPIGVVHTPFKDKKGMPIQGGLHPDVKGKIEVYKEYMEGLLDLEGFSHIILLYVFHKSDGYTLKQKPFLDDMEHGVFAIRSPKRPNPIGMTVVRLDKIEDNILHVSRVDMLDGTPLLDIKPYVPDFDQRENVRIGWLEGKIKGKHLSDGRFKNAEVKQ
jgi:tRNA-Thr(GGU) m(6)t(6)A37 methyltransferase TsaA